MTTIHPTAVVAPGARLGEDVSVGPYAVIGPEAVLGDRCKIDAHAVVDGASELGPDCQVFPFAHVGGKTQDLKFREGNRTFVKIGARTVLRECVTVNCGTKDGESTTIGDDCLIMAYCHVAHGCVFGNHVIVSNASQFAGEVQVGDWAVISGLVGVHQFVRIGCHAMIGGGTLLKQDAAPYFITDGNPPAAHSVNLVGLQRRGFSAEAIGALRSAYKLLCRGGMNVSAAAAAIREQLPATPEIATLLGFFESSARGVIR
ncbi:MAG: acyl-ACP--UDP-N-acetylglucosamine O-acyltransferase [Kiritimatiellae bacterium]|nr:acyl-ACP--UDP-N-acetylglucosamine O-acyltransferase [Kiritimatiellia bacterium]